MTTQNTPNSCYRHPDRWGGVTCQRCDQPICTSCMHQASIGFHCSECTAKRGFRTAKIGSMRVSGPRSSIRKLQVSRLSVTSVIISFNIMAYVVSSILSRTPFGMSRTLLVDFALISRLEYRYQIGLRIFTGEIGVKAGEWYRLATSAFLHDGLIHLAFNMYALAILGLLLEKELGVVRFLLVYALSTLGGALGAIILSPVDLTVGASGAIYGLLGALVVIQRSIQGSFRNSPLMFLLIINLLFTFAIPQISVGGHLGGLIVGAAIGGLMVQFENHGRPKWMATMIGGLWMVTLFALCISDIT